MARRTSARATGTPISIFIFELLFCIAGCGDAEFEGAVTGICEGVTGICDDVTTSCDMAAFEVVGLDIEKLDEDVATTDRELINAAVEDPKVVDAPAWRG